MSKLITILSIAFCTLFYCSSSAQVTSGLGYFQVDYNEGCAPFVANVTVIAPAQCACNVYPNGVNGNDQPIPILDGDNTALVSYDAPGTYELEVAINNAAPGSPQVDRLTITVYENIPPEFTATTCSNREVAIDIIDTNYDQYVVDYGDGSLVEVFPKGVDPSPKTYPAVQTYNITVTGEYLGAPTGSCSPNTKPVITLGTSVPDALISRLTLNSPTEGELSFTSTPNVTYYLEVQANGDDANGFSRYSNNPLGTTSPLILNRDILDFENNYYCFRIATIDPCQPVPTVGYSNMICSADLDEIQVGDLANTLIINSTGFFDAQYNRLDKAGVEAPYSSSANTTPIIDNNINNNLKCNIEYGYTAILQFHDGQGGFAVSTSLERVATALSLSTPAPLEDISIDATSAPELTWLTPTNYIPTTYHINFNSGTQNVSPSLPFIDTNNDPTTSSVCYEIGYTEECGNTTEVSLTACSIYLRSNSRQAATTLQWNAYDGWQNGVDEYQLIQTINDATPTMIYNGSALSFELSNVQEEQNVIYQVTAIPNDPLLDSALSNVLLVTNRSNITFPNAFLVNGSSGNFKPVGRYITKVDMKIYTRWGELIAHITGVNEGWDGTRNGNKLPGGNYIYIAKVEDEAGNTHEHEGSVLLLQN